MWLLSASHLLASGQSALSVGNHFSSIQPAVCVASSWGKSVTEARVGLRWPGARGFSLSRVPRSGTSRTRPPVQILASSLINLKFCSFSVISFFICTMELVITFVSYIYCTVYTGCAY